MKCKVFIKIPNKAINIPTIAIRRLRPYNIQRLIHSLEKLLKNAWGQAEKRFSRYAPFSIFPNQNNAQLQGKCIEVKHKKKDAKAQFPPSAN